MKIYYAHSLHLYDTPQEVRDLYVLRKLGFQVENPNFPTHHHKCAEIRNTYSDYDEGSSKIMEYFTSVIEDCDALAFRAHIDGRIPSGVGMEVRKALELNIPVIEVPTFINSKFMTKAETREYLQYLGQR